MHAWEVGAVPIRRICIYTVQCLHKKVCVCACACVCVCVCVCVRERESQQVPVVSEQFDISILNFAV